MEEVAFPGEEVQRLEFAHQEVVEASPDEVAHQAFQVLVAATLVVEDLSSSVEVVVPWASDQTEAETVQDHQA